MRNGAAAGVLGAKVERFPPRGGDAPVMPSNGTRIISAADLDEFDFPEIKFIVHGLIVEGLTILAGKPKFGKSFLVLQLLIGVASGTLALNDLECDAGDVLYVAGEDNERRLQRRLRQILGRGPKPKRLHLTTSWPKIGDGCIEALERWLDDHPDARMIVLDTWSVIKPRSNGQRGVYDEDADGVRPLQRLASERGVAVILVHHTRKAEADDVFDTVSGSLGLTGVADTILIAGRSDDRCLLSGKGRDIEEFEKVIKRDPHMGTWTILGDSATVPDTPEQQAVVHVLAKAGTPMTATQIGEVLKKDRTAVQHMLRRLRLHGKVEYHGRSGYSVPLFTNVTNVTQPPAHSEHSDDSDGGTYAREMSEPSFPDEEDSE
ncbi:AAA family ATPase [Sphingosinicella sp.]|uniref:AAA family ATPase n=1 Tax=Sphingosinicella sp. TaxID=1917971 RepID=UPI00261E7873|nr:AAA family ATPase [Sphingosinicella sp.]